MARIRCSTCGFIRKLHTLNHPTLCRRCYRQLTIDRPFTRLRLPNGRIIQVNTRWLNRLRGAMKGNAAIRAKGLSHQFTPEEARKAITRTWKTKYRKVHGRRLLTPMALKGKGKKARRRHPAADGVEIADQIKP